MKKFAIKIILILSFLSFSSLYSISYVHAIKVEVTEKIPGAGCNPKETTKKGEDGKEIKTIEQNLYVCDIEPGFGTVMTMMGKIIQYFVFIASLGGVLFIVINGIMYSMSGADPSLKDESKKRIIQTLIGLILLLLSGVILNLIAPWIWVL